MNYGEQCPCRGRREKAAAGGRDWGDFTKDGIFELNFIQKLN
jgi:hypothetical protein